MRIRPLLWFLGLVGTLAALSIAVGSGRIIHAQVYGSPPLPPTVNIVPPAVAPPIVVAAINPPPTGSNPPPQQVTPSSPTAAPPTVAPPIVVSPLNPQSPPTAAPPATTPPTTTISVSGLPSTGVMSKMTTLVEQPLFELIVGVGILSALGIFFGWNARTARPQRLTASAPLASAGVSPSPALPAPRRRATAPRAAGEPLPSLTARLRPLGALRERTDH